MNRSIELFERARRLMPWGTQTNAKRPEPALLDAMPLFIERGDGCRIQDVDGAWYIDYRSSLGPILLGHKYPAVEEAVRAQLEKGVLFSMASPLEIEVAERLMDLVPGLEQLHFAKTGNDANQACIRLARAFTGRDHIATCAYHGHGEWFSSGRGPAPLWCRREGNGVPRVFDELVHRLPYADIEAAEAVFKEYGDRLAAVIMVPYDWNEVVGHDFVRRMRELTLQNGALLVFDQVLTGFRLARGGAQEFFGVVPDLTSYAKALANGYPLAVYGGRRDVMEKLYDVILTTTYAGETLSLAAAKATLDVVASQPVIEHIWRMGERLGRGFDAAARDLGLPFRTFGLPPAVQFRFDPDPERDEDLRMRFFRELFGMGIFAARPFLLNYAHQEADVDETIEKMRHALELIPARSVASSP